MLAKLLSAIAILTVSLAASATEYRTVEHPRQECWNERVAQQSSGYGGAILGGLTGGLLGNQVGGGNGRTVATAVGAATGAVVGDRISGSPGYQTVQRCHTVIDREQVPVYREPVRYIREPIVEERVYYIDREDHYYRHKHKHHHHHDDDDDD